jgi:N-acetylmuramoyl-L-alanine amidase
VKGFFKGLLFFICFITLTINSVYASQKIKVLNLRTQEFQDYKRFIIDLSQRPTYKVLTLHKPERVVIDINNTDYIINKSEFEADRVIDSVRTGRYNDGIRIVLDINTRAEVVKHFILAPSKTRNNWRLVADVSKKGLEQIINKEKLLSEKEIILTQAPSNDVNAEITYDEKLALNKLIDGFVIEDKTNTQTIKQADSVRIKTTPDDSSMARPMLKPDINIMNTKNETINTIVDTSSQARLSTHETNVVSQIAAPRRQEKLKRYREINPRDRTSTRVITQRKYNIVIDAGHGGKDPGTIGRRGTQEKTITLQYAKLLANELKKSGKYNVYLTRKGDYFISLNDRVKRAREYKADLFISIHADYSSNRYTTGLSVYTLSQRASDTRTARLAQKENKADIIGGLNLYGEYQDTINVLVDLSRRQAMNSSSKFAEIVLKEMKRNRIKTLGDAHKFGNFAVLLAPDTASVLIELGFLSNKAEEQRLKSWDFKQRFVKGIISSLDKYFQ